MLLSVAIAVLVAYENVCLIYCSKVQMKLHQQVANVFYSGFENCLLQTQDTMTTMPFVCIAQCQAHPQCRLACLKDTTCSLYSANVAPYYNSSNLDPAGLPKEELQATCYSSWIYENDISYLITSVDGSPHHGTTNHGAIDVEKSVDGYLCNAGHPLHYYHSTGLSNPYVCISFEVFVHVEKVIVETRGSGGGLTYFADMEVRIGNFSCTGDSCDQTTFEKNDKIGDRYGSIAAPGGEIVTFEGSSSPLVGKHVIIRSLESYGYLIVGELKIIGKRIP